MHHDIQVFVISLHYSQECNALDHLLASMSVGSIPPLQACKSPRRSPRRSACYRSCEGHDPYICDAKIPIHPIMQ